MRERVGRYALAVGSLLALAAVGCGPMPIEGGDGGVLSDGAPATDACQGASPCECAERTPPDPASHAEGRPSATSDLEQQAALRRANHWRTRAGLAPFDAHAQVERAAAAHAQFMATNPQERCWPAVHDEVEEGCAGFTGRTIGDRMTAAGYAWSRSSEVIDWEGDVERAVDAWVWTVYHRQPLFDWRYAHLGFGRAYGPLRDAEAHHNVMTFGAPRGENPATPPSEPAVFPAPGQTDVPPAFRGDLEGPTPPAPGGQARWPSGVASGAVVSVHFPSNDWTVTTHRIFRADAACGELPSTFVSRDTDPNLNPRLRDPASRATPANDVFLYADQPLESGTAYVVQFEGTVDGRPWARTWAFTTR